MSFTTFLILISFAYFPGFFIYSAIATEKTRLGKLEMFSGAVGLIGVLLGVFNLNLWVLVVGVIGIVVASRIRTVRAQQETQQ